MSNAYLNLIGGLSGDMLLSSLIDAGLDPKKLSKELRKLIYVLAILNIAFLKKLIIGLISGFFNNKGCWYISI